MRGRPTQETFVPAPKDKQDETVWLVKSTEEYLDSKRSGEHEKIVDMLQAEKAIEVHDIQKRIEQEFDPKKQADFNDLAELKKKSELVKQDFRKEETQGFQDSKTGVSRPQEQLNEARFLSMQKESLQNSQISQHNTSKKHPQFHIELSIQEPQASDSDSSSTSNDPPAPEIFLKDRAQAYQTMPQFF